VLPSTLTVTNTNDKGPGSLRDTITNAKGGDTIIFAPALDGQTITLTSDQLTVNNSLDIEGPGPGRLTISGNGTNRIFAINEGLTVTIDGVTLAQGRAVGGLGNPNGSGGGGALLNAGSVVKLGNDLFWENVSLGSTGDGGPKGGAIACFGSGALTVTNSNFLDNRADGSVKNSQWAEGGAIFSNRDGPSVTVSGCAFTGNQAIGGNGGVLPPGSFGVGDASGGAIHVEGNSSTLTVVDCTFTDNRASAGNGSSAPKGSNLGGYYVDGADGGAIVCHDGANLFVSGSTFTNNAAVGGSGANGASITSGWLGTGLGGAIHAQGATTIASSSFLGNAAVGGNGDTAGSGIILVGGGDGGAIYKDAFVSSAAPLGVSNTTFSNNHAVGGAGGAGGIFAGDGIGGAIMTVDHVPTGVPVTATVSGSTFSGNQAVGGAGAAGGNGADGLGGALANVLGSTLTVSGCTLTGNQATGGAGGSGGNGGDGFGGGLYNDGASTLTVTGSTITSNQAVGGAAGSGGSAGPGVGGGLYLAVGGAAYLDTYTLADLLGNTASTSNNDLFGPFTKY
jgi:hypothetical protein